MTCSTDFHRQRKAKWWSEDPSRPGLVMVLCDDCAAVCAGLNVKVKQMRYGR